MSISSWYEILLRSFPRHYRRVRGAEMLSTLLDGAKPGQARPSLREAIGIVGAGLRCRVRIRRGPLTLLAAIAATVAGSILTATLFAWAAWTITAPPLPGKAEADAIAHAVVASEPVREHRYDFLFGDDGYDVGTAGRVEYEYDELIVRTHVLPAVPGMQVMLSHNTLTIVRATPPAVPWLTVLGALIGAAAGWMLAARSSRLVARRHPVMVATTIVLASLTFVALTPMCFYTAMLLMYGIERGAPWTTLYWGPTRVPTVIGLLSAALTLILIEASRTTPRPVGGVTG